MVRTECFRGRLSHPVYRKKPPLGGDQVLRESVPRPPDSTRVLWLGGGVRWLRQVTLCQGRPSVRPPGQAIRPLLADLLRGSSYDHLYSGDLRSKVRVAATTSRIVS